MPCIKMRSTANTIRERRHTVPRQTYMCSVYEQQDQRHRGGGTSVARAVVMRSVLCLLLVACANEGAHLTLHAPDGVAATSFQVVLASPDLIPIVANQRTSPR